MKKKSLVSAVILAGGLGTRLRSVVEDVPKPMAPVKGIPFLKYLINYLVKEGICKIVISTGYKSEIIMSYFGDEYCGVPIRYIREDSPLGTGGAIRMVVNSVDWSPMDYFLLVNGDTWFEVNLREFAEVAARIQKPVTMALKYMERNDRYAAVILDHESVKSFSEEKHEKCLVNGGWYILNYGFLAGYLNNFPQKFSFETDLLKPLVLTGSVAGVVQNEKFLDIGVPEDFFRASSVISLF